MAEDVKSGKQVIDEFFSELPDIIGVDKGITDIIMKLQKENKLTPTNLTNELSENREAKINGKN